MRILLFYVLHVSCHANESLASLPTVSSPTFLAELLGIVTKQELCHPSTGIFQVRGPLLGITLAKAFAFLMGFSYKETIFFFMPL